MLQRSLMILALAAPMYAGGGAFLLSLGNPAAVNDPEARGALATVRVVACMGHASTQPPPVVTAEGLVNGQRVTQSVRLAPVRGTDLTAIHWTRPQEGAWVLRFLSSNYEAYVLVGETGVRAQSQLMQVGNATNAVLAKMGPAAKVTAAR